MLGVMHVPPREDGDNGDDDGDDGCAMMFWLLPRLDASGFLAGGNRSTHNERLR